MTKTTKRKEQRKRAKDRGYKICNYKQGKRVKRCYTEEEAAHAAGYQALKKNVHLCIYKCPGGDHWHLTRSKNHAKYL